MEHVREVGAVWTPPAEQRVRVLLERADGYRGLLWFSVSRDGSISLAPRHKGPSSVQTGTSPLEAGKVRVDYAAGSEVEDPEARSGPHLSVHSSGLRKGAGHRGWGPSLRDLQEQTFLAMLVFRHPDTYGLVSVVRPFDIVLRYPVDDARPLGLSLYVAPAGATQLVELSAAEHQLNLVMHYPELAKPLDYQLVLHHGPEGPHPPKSYAVWNSEPE